MGRVGFMVIVLIITLASGATQCFFKRGSLSLGRFIRRAGRIADRMGWEKLPWLFLVGSMDVFAPFLGAKQWIFQVNIAAEGTLIVF